MDVERTVDVLPNTECQTKEQQVHCTNFSKSGMTDLGSKLQHTDQKTSS